MALQFVTINGVDLSHDKMIGLNRAGYLRLGLNYDLLDGIKSLKKLNKAKAWEATDLFWTGVVGVGLVASVYLAINVAWWLGVPSFAACYMLHKANNDLSPDRLLAAGMADPEFYEKVQQINGWLYEVEERVALFLTIKPQLPDDLQAAHDIAAEFADCMERHKGRRMLDMSLLPYDKEVIEQALDTIMHQSKDAEMQGAAKVARIALGHYRTGIGEPARYQGACQQKGEQCRFGDMKLHAAQEVTLVKRKEVTP